MDKLTILKRWSDGEFLRQVAPILKALFIQKTSAATADIRGIVVGLEGALPELVNGDCQRLMASNIDASHSKMSCSFSRARISQSSFSSSFFDTCRFNDSEFRDTSFELSKIDSPSFDDAKFFRCSFVDAQITGRHHQEYGGRRFLFEQCNFTGATFRNLQLRACLFRDCRFDGVLFHKCLLVGAKFEGTSPVSGSFADCK